MQASKIAYTSIFSLGVVVGILLGQFVTIKVAQAATSYEMISSPSVGFFDQAEPTTPTSTNRYVFRYKIPLGTTFDRLQIHVPDNQPELIGNGFYFGTMLDNDDLLSSCNNAFCVSTDLDISQIYRSGSFKNGNAQTFVFSTTTTISNNPREYFIMTFNPNSAGENVLYYQSINSIGYSENGLNLLRVNAAPTLKFCNGPCGDDNFSFITGTVPAQNSIISIQEPLQYGATISSTTLNTKVFYFYDSAQSTTTRAQYSIYDGVTNELEYNIFQIVPAGFEVNFSIENLITLQPGSKKMVASYVIASNNQALIPEKETFFHVLENSYLIATGLENPRGNASSLTQIDCSTFDIGCQFQKAMTFLFVPTPNTLNKFSDLYQELLYLKPFGYATIFIQQLNGISDNQPGAYTLPEIPFNQSIFEPFKNGLGVLLWGIFAFAFYNKRIKNLDI